MSDSQEKLARRLIDAVGFRKVIKALMMGAEPTNLEEGLEMIDVLARALAAAIGWEASRHIQDHQGDDCAKNLIERTGDKVKVLSYEYLEKLLDTLGLARMEPTVNECTTAAILKEIEDDG